MEQSFLKGHANNRSRKAAAKRISHGATTAQAVPIALTSTAFHLFFFPLQTRVERFRSLKCHVNNAGDGLDRSKPTQRHRQCEYKAGEAEVGSVTGGAGQGGWQGRDALEGKGPQKGAQKRLDRRLQSGLGAVTVGGAGAQAEAGSEAGGGDGGRSRRWFVPLFPCTCTTTPLDILCPLRSSNLNCGWQLIFWSCGTACAKGSVPDRTSTPLMYGSPRFPNQTWQGAPAVRACGNGCCILQNEPPQAPEPPLLGPVVRGGWATDGGACSQCPE